MSGFFDLLDICKAYGSRKVLDKVSLSVKQGQLCCIVGASGIGKSTLLHIAGLLDEADSGDVIFQGAKVQLSDAGNARRKFGFMYQKHYLIGELRAWENVAIPMQLNTIKEYRSKACATLDQVGLAEYVDHFPHQMSGGQQQRVALARCIAHEPYIIFADEPTGNLDNNNAHNVFRIIKEYCSKNNAAIVVTHNIALAEAFADFIVQI